MDGDPNDHSQKLIVQKGGKMSYPTGTYESSDEESFTGSGSDMPLYESTRISGHAIDVHPANTHSVAEFSTGKSSNMPQLL